MISTDCPSGPREIVRDGVDGVLVPPNDVDALAAVMDHLMADRAERRQLEAHAVGVVERFSLENMMDMWDEVLIRACRHSLNEGGAATEAHLARHGGLNRRVAVRGAKAGTDP